MDLRDLLITIISVCLILLSLQLILLENKIDNIIKIQNVKEAKSGNLL
jgi:hypothetical protein